MPCVQTAPSGVRAKRCSNETKTSITSVLVSGAAPHLFGEQSGQRCGLPKRVSRTVQHRHSKGQENTRLRGHPCVWRWRLVLIPQEPWRPPGRGQTRSSRAAKRNRHEAPVSKASRLECGSSALRWVLRLSSFSRLLTLPGPRRRSLSHVRTLRTVRRIRPVEFRSRGIRQEGGRRRQDASFAGCAVRACGLGGQRMRRTPFPEQASNTGGKNGIEPPGFRPALPSTRMPFVEPSRTAGNRRTRRLASIAINQIATNGTKAVICTTSN